MYIRIVGGKRKKRRNIWCILARPVLTPMAIGTSLSRLAGASRQLLGKEN
jgi:hypothetical protein